MSWARYHIGHLRKWREAAEKIKRAVEDLGLNAEVYVVGGAAEGRLTILSDVDVLVCLREDLPDKVKRELRKRILSTAMDRHGLPWDYPLELHICAGSECRALLERAGRSIKL